MTLSGIDVSDAGQGANFPWDSYKGRIQFAGIKISEGTSYADPDAAHNIACARSLGLVVTGYHFLHAGLPGSSQAEAFLSHAHAAGFGPGDLIAVDCEDGGLDGEGAASMNITALSFTAELQRHFPGYHPVVYTEISMAPALVSLGSCPLWLANPGGAPVKAIGPWSAVSFEQLSQRYVDTDVFYGTLDQLKKLAVP